MQLKKLLLIGLGAWALTACNTNTYVSKENIEKFDNHVKKFLIAECMEPQREIKLAVAEHFDFDKSELMSADHAALNQFINDVRGLKGRIAIVAHTDYQGSDEYNEKLSFRRANSVKKYLIEQLDFKNYQWDVEYFGERMPMMEGHTEEANAANRRAYVIFEQTLDPETNPDCLPKDTAPEPEKRVYVAMTSHFDFDKSILKEKDQTELDELIYKLDGLSGHIMIAGHTDYHGSESYNIKLSEARSIAVQEYMKSKLVDPDNFVWEVKAFGENSPLIQEHSKNADAENRRVFVVFREGDIETVTTEAITPL